MSEPRQYTIEKEQIARLLAMAIDTDGCIPSDYFKINFANSSKELVEYVASLLRTIIPNWVSVHSYETGYRTAWLVEIYADHAVQKVLQEIEPFLIVKKKQARKVLTYFELHPPKERRKPIKAASVIQLYNQGFSDIEIAVKLNSLPDYIKRFRQRRNLPKND